jgi:hypothetical protein
MLCSRASGDSIVNDMSHPGEEPLDQHLFFVRHLTSR